jgi:Caspase domain
VAHRALLICNWEYGDPQKVYEPLKGPRNDLTLMQSALRDPRYGLFEVEPRENLGWAKIRAEFSGFLKAATPADSLLLYYSGHGDRLGDGRLALCGVDTDSENVAATSFDTNELREWIESANRAPSTMVILDCCYAGAMKGALGEEDIVASLGAGTMVLSSSASQPVKDAASEDEGSPFTVALSKILLDPEVTGDENGLLTIDRVYQQLLEHEPPLLPPPKRNVRSQGTFALARRERALAQVRPALPGFQETEFETINLTFDGTAVVAEWEMDSSETFELAGFDDHRRAAVRRISQLADAILRVSDYYEDEWAQRAVRRAWNCIGSTLFETAVPTGVQERLRTLDNAPPGAPLLKLRLCFADNPDARRLEAYPWEYLYRDRDPGIDSEVREPEPLALVPGLLLERVIRSEGPATLDTRIAGGGAGEAGERDAAATVGLISSLRGQFGDAAEQMADDVANMAGVNVVFDLRAGEARWSTFLDVVVQGPNLLLMFAPIRRRPQGVEIGFSSSAPTGEGQATAEWHTVGEMINQFKANGLSFGAIVFVTFAANPGQDSFRATVELGRTVATAGIGPVVFVCHAPGYAREVPALGRNTFPVLLVDVLTREERFDHAVYYAKNRVTVQGSQESRRTFGVPGYYVLEPVGGEHGAQVSPSSSTAPRSAEPPGARAAAPKARR